MPCIRRVKEEDCKRIHEIYSYYVLNTAISFDLSVPDEKEFKEKTAHISAKHPYLVIEDEGEIMWNDPDVGIDWPDVGEVLLSEKDKKHSALKDAKVEF